MKGETQKKKISSLSFDGVMCVPYIVTIPKRTTNSYWMVLNVKHSTFNLWEHGVYEILKIENIHLMKMLNAVCWMLNVESKNHILFHSERYLWTCAGAILKQRCNEKKIDYNGNDDYKFENLNWISLVAPLHHRLWFLVVLLFFFSSAK